MNEMNVKKVNVFTRECIIIITRFCFAADEARGTRLSSIYSYLYTAVYMTQIKYIKI